MAKKSVVTKSELNETITEKKSVEEKVEKSSPSEKKTEKKPIEKTPVGVKFEVPFAPLGQANVAFTHQYKGVSFTYNIKTVNRIFELPKNLNADETKRYRQALKDNGCKDVTVIDSGVVYDEIKGSYVYKAVHPEHTDRNRINGTISLALQNDSGKPIFDEKGKQVTKQVSIVNGLVKTDDEDVYAALLKSGFYNAGKTRKEE